MHRKEMVCNVEETELQTPPCDLHCEVEQINRQYWEKIGSWERLLDNWYLFKYVLLCSNSPKILWILELEQNFKK